MFAINWIPFLTFLLITTLTPGPNNISCMSMGVQYGYKRSLAYIGGIVFGMFVQSMISGLISTTLFSLFPGFETILRYIGGAYIVWLAIITFKSEFCTDPSGSTPMGMKDGFYFNF